MKTILFMVIVVSFFLLTSCSVYMAAKKKGVSIEEISQCKTKSCLHSKGATLIDSKRNEDGILIETYKVRKPTGSTARAVMHGVLDVATLGVWEVVGTPIEGVKGKEEYISIRVYFESDDETIKNVELVR